MIVAEAVETQTARLLFQLEEESPAGTVSALDGSGLSLTGAFITSVDGQAVPTSGKIGWHNRSAGQVYFAPTDSDLWALKSPYRVRFQITDSDGLIRYYPDAGRSAEIKVHPRTQ